ncbi:response regulator transcription factor [Bacillus sp. 1NLA3E]|uniref:response regulator transcription factor n=1 Tax=Bacillus sp. 1NLA3E TaxID=666686 RepID=UPI000247F30F|nr:response regulator transcription factor [Bacillus sp. 1NLA3E]AGK55354.1 response regulator containing a CheY-like receiver domain and an HTH DNA-binding domain [Bacillus sp. 1NLA3E]
MIQILLVDDHPLVGEGTKLIIETEGDMKVEFETSPIQAIERLKTHSFNVLLFDLTMPQMDGFELTKKALAIDPQANVLIFSECDIYPNLDLLMESGAVGFIAKTATKEQLIRAIRCALNQEMVVPFSWLKDIYHGDRPWVKRKMFKEKISLTDKEKKIMKELVKGKTNKEMAQTLFVGQRSFEYSLTKIFHKLGVQTRIEAVVKVKEMGLIVD